MPSATLCGTGGTDGGENLPVPDRLPRDDDEDETGELFMEWVLSDIVHRPDRWEIITAPNGRLSAIKLIREDIAEALEHAREIYNNGRRANSSR